MNQQQFLSRLEELYNINLEISKKKNADYAGEVDPFKNFRLVETLGLCSTEVGIMVRMCDKISRISNLLDSEEKVEDEKVADTLSDLSNYSMILRMYLEEKNGKL
jgi:hypothetical protein